MRTYFLDIPFEQRGIRLPGVSYDSRLRKTVYVGDKLPQELIPYQSPEFSLLRWQEDNYNKKILPPVPLPYKMTPRPHQKEAAIKIAKFAKAGGRGFVEGDNVGLGKTISSAFGVYGAMKTKGQKTAKVLVICPKSVIDHWARTFKALGIAQNIRLCIINYEQSKKLLQPPKSAKTVKKTATKNRHTAEKGTPTVMWDYIIADESQKLKNSDTAQQSAAFRRIARYAEATNYPFVIWASATIGQDPLELQYLQPLLYEITGTPLRMPWNTWLLKQGFHIEIAKSSGKASWVKPNKNTTQLEAKRIAAQRRSDLEKLNSILFSPSSPSIRRNPTDIAGWPKVQRIAQGVALTPGEYLTYQKEWLDFRSGYKLSLKGRNPKGALAQQLRFRQKSSLIRAPHTVDTILDMLDNGLQVAVYVEFMESIEKMKTALEKKGVHSSVFTGQNISERENDRLKFQKGINKVIFFSTAQGISLHANEQLPDGSKASPTQRATLLHDTTYSGLNCAQIEGRCHRDSEFAKVYYMYATGTVEEKISKTMIGRVRNIISIMDDETLAAELDGILAA